MSKRKKDDVNLFKYKRRELGVSDLDLLSTLVDHSTKQTALACKCFLRCFDGSSLDNIRWSSLIREEHHKERESDVCLCMCGPNMSWIPELLFVCNV